MASRITAPTCFAPVRAAVMAAAILYPIGLILKRLGFSPFWSVLALVPGINLIALWVLALTSSADGKTEIRS